MGKRGPTKRWSEAYQRAAALGTVPRTAKNEAYRQRALDALGFQTVHWDQQQFSWLADWDVYVESGGERGLRRTILAELGHVQSADEIRQMARRLCDAAARRKSVGAKGPTTAFAVSQIRRWLGRTKKMEGDPVEPLATQLVAFVLRRMQTWDWSAIEVTPEQAFEQAFEKALEMVLGRRLPF